MEENKTLCAASAYEKKYYFNEEFGRLPSNIQKELQIMCVIFTEDCGGVIRLEFDKEGELLIKTEADESDYLYDEVSAGMLLAQMRREKEELFEALERFYKVFFIYAKKENAAHDGDEPVSDN